MTDIINLNTDCEYLLIRPKHEAGYGIPNEDVIADLAKKGVKIVSVINDDKVTSWQFIALPLVLPIPEDTERPREDDRIE